MAVLLPLSGQSASFGSFSKNAIELAMDKFSPEQKNLVSIRFEDDQIKPATSVAIAKRLINSNQADAFFVFGSGVGNALAPIAEQHGRLLIALGASDNNIVKGKKFSFIHWVPPANEVKVMLSAIEKKGYKKLAVAGAEIPGAHAIVDEVKKQLKEQGKESLLVHEGFFNMEETDFQTFISKLKTKEVDGVLVCLFPGQLSSFAKQAKLLELKGDLIGIETFEDSNEVRASEGTLVGSWYVNADSGNQEFYNAYQDKYKDVPGVAAPNAYDSINLILQAVKESGNDNIKIAGYLNSVKNYHGAAGDYSAIGNHWFDLPVAIKIVEKNGFRKIE